MPAPKHFINKPEDAVGEFIEGLLLQYPNALKKLANQNVLLSSTTASENVKLLSGGGSGHEPSHAGWIGEGMLHGAILGGMFASPTVSQILAAIRASSPAGVLLVVKNYTGDRLNFGMACEKANAEGIPCKMVVVADDCALPREKGITGARGVAGTVLVHKIAGAAAAKGATLDEVTAMANKVCSRMGTLGVALDAVTVPGAATMNDRLSKGDNKMVEIGLGIHGEAGMRQASLMSSDEFAKEMVTTIRDFGRFDEESGEIVPLFKSGDDVCILVNNLGGTSNFEMSILVRSIVKQLEEEEGCTVSRILVGSFMTSFDMHGASLTILPLMGDTELMELLDADCSALAWSKCDVWKKEDAATRASATEIPEKEPAESVTAAAAKLPEIQLAAPFDTTAASMLKEAANVLVENEPLLTKYDTIVGDGDCGITMKRGATEILSRLESNTLELSHPATLFSSLADAVSASMGGTSGVLLELMFRKMSTTVASGGVVDAKAMHEAFQAGVEAVSYYGGATVGARTMLDAMVPAAASLLESGLAAAIASAKEGADSTAAMEVASAGRSNYVGKETLVGTPDPGAVAVALVLEAVGKV